MEKTVKKRVYYIDNNSRLKNACKSGDVNLVKLILQDIYIKGEDKNKFIEKMFKIVCIKGHLEIAKLLFNNFPNINVVRQCALAHTNLYYACDNGQLEMAKWLLSIKPDMLENILKNADTLFIGICERGHIDMATFLLELKPDINISMYNEVTFIKVCTEGNLEMAKFLLRMKPDINISIDDETPFRIACGQDTLEMAQWLLSIKPDINISANNDAPFCNACRRGNIKMAKWLLSIKPDINISSGNDSAFFATCVYNRLETAKWLLSIKPDINMYYYDRQYTIHTLCKPGKLEMAKWLYDINPELFLSTLNANYKDIIYGTYEDMFHLNPYEPTNLETIKWLFTIKPEIDETLSDEFFIKACSKNKLEFAKWLYTVKKSITVSVFERALKESSCYLDVIEWLLYTNPDKTVSTTYMLKVIWSMNDEPIYEETVYENEDED